MKYIRGLLIFALGFVVGIVAMFVWLDRYAPSSYEECAESSWSAVNTSDPPQCYDITGRVWIGPTWTPSEPTTTLNEQMFPQPVDTTSCPIVVNLCDVNAHD